MRSFCSFKRRWGFSWSLDDEILRWKKFLLYLQEGGTLLHKPVSWHTIDDSPVPCNYSILIRYDLHFIEKSPCSVNPFKHEKVSKAPTAYFLWPKTPDVESILPLSGTRGCGHWIALQVYYIFKGFIKEEKSFTFASGWTRGPVSAS